MKKNIAHYILHAKTRGFTLIEALVSAFVVSSVVLGPLTVAMDSTSNARLTKDTITGIYLAQEAIELLRAQADSIYINCTQSTGAFCIFQAGETASEATWRIFKSRLSRNLEGESCYVNETPEGCSYDVIDMTGDQTIDPPKYKSGDDMCRMLATSPDSIYVCAGEHPSYPLSKFSRAVSIQSLPTFTGPDENLNDDLRVTATVTFRRPSGFNKEIKLVDFLHARS
jgi:type II secretory pathway pseudopilin PulG